MFQVQPLHGSDLWWFRQRFRLWSKKILLGALLSHPRDWRAILRRAERNGRSWFLLSGVKPVQFKDTGGARYIKAVVYGPSVPGEAWIRRLKRSLRKEIVGPEVVTLSITDRCPYRCPFCSNARAPSKPLPLHRLEAVIHELQSVGGAWLNIGGGEPVLAYDRARAVVKAAGRRSETWLNTTGFDLDVAKIRELKSLGLFGGRVSIHRALANEHDEFVGYKGAFSIATTALECMREEGLFTVLSAAWPVERVTRENLADMMELGKDLGVGIVEIIPVRPAGRAIISCQGAVPARYELTDSLFEEFNLAPQYADYPNLCSPLYLETPYRYGCTAGSERLYISAAGDVQPCPLVSVSVGNLDHESLGDILNRMRSLIPGPRRSLLCADLGDLLGKHLRSFDDELTALPVSPEKAVELLGQLPESPPPAAWEP